MANVDSVQLCDQPVQRRGEDFVLVEQAESFGQMQQSLSKDIKKFNDMFTKLEGQTKQIVSTNKFQEKFWCAFLAFNLMVMPALLAMAFGYLTEDPSLPNEHQATRQHFMSLMVAISLVVGLPFYLYTLIDLEDAYRGMKIQDHQATQGTQTAENTQNSDESDKEGKGDVASQSVTISAS